jgi:hypothetical protein
VHLVDIIVHDTPSGLYPSSPFTTLLVQRLPQAQSHHLCIQVPRRPTIEFDPSDPRETHQQAKDRAATMI